MPSTNSASTLRLTIDAKTIKLQPAFAQNTIGAACRTFIMPAWTKSERMNAAALPLWVIKPSVAPDVAIPTELPLSRVMSCWNLPPDSFFR